MYEKMTAAYHEANARANSTNKEKVFEYTILDRSFHEVEKGFCTNVQRSYDPCYDWNWVSFTDINTNKTRSICQFYVRMKEVDVNNEDNVCAKQPKAINYDRLTPSWYIYTDAEGIAHSQTFGEIDMDKFFYNVSKRIAFDDLSNETVQKIYFRGQEVEYAGWKPGMRFEYQDLDGNTIWVGTFEHWDH